MKQNTYDSLLANSAVFKERIKKTAQATEIVNIRWQKQIKAVAADIDSLTKDLPNVTYKQLSINMRCIQNVLKMQVKL